MSKQGGDTKSLYNTINSLFGLELDDQYIYTVESKLLKKIPKQEGDPVSISVEDNEQIVAFKVDSSSIYYLSGYYSSEEERMIREIKRMPK